MVSTTYPGTVHADLQFRIPRFEACVDKVDLGEPTQITPKPFTDDVNLLQAIPLDLDFQVGAADKGSSPPEEGGLGDEDPFRSRDPLGPPPHFGNHPAHSGQGMILGMDDGPHDGVLHSCHGEHPVDLGQIKAALELYQDLLTLTDVQAWGGPNEDEN